MQDVLTVVAEDEDVFVGRSPAAPPPRVFGGVILAQALRAAQQTVSRPTHSLHAYFLRPGDPEAPLRYRVRRLRDGGSFSSREITVSQADRDLCVMLASFHDGEPSFTHQAAMPATPQPERLATAEELAEREDAPPSPAVAAYLRRERPVELRPVDPARFLPKLRAGLPRGDVWVRWRRPLGDDPAIHQAALTYITDMTLLDVALTPHETTVFDSAVAAASLDHALWFHDDFRADDWLLFTQRSPRAGHGRGMAVGEIFDRRRRLVASVAQEGLLRRR
ncbi:MAG TPA: acyl-CoA thioesterase II [Beijerinckiaceae bacterium]|jgi:acyl-CoA thioesterase-2